MRSTRVAAVVAALTATVAAGWGTPAGAAVSTKAKVRIGEFTLPDPALDTLRDRWLSQLRHSYGTNTWAPMKFDLGNRELKLLGLPSKRWLITHRGTFSKPTVVGRQCKKRQLDPAVVTYGGAGYFGIRPGAWLLSITSTSVGWCTMAHAYGSPGAYSISTAGHCGKPGDTATVIGAVGNRLPVLLDFGSFSTSHDGGLGNDWALISVNSAYQSLVSPTMAFWGGPRGMFTSTGSVVSINPDVEVTADPTVAQDIVHYGHGTGIGAGGTPRSGVSLSWSSNVFMFFGAITPGDSGSGSNTLKGDTVTDVLEAAGINTHLYIASNMDEGVGIMGGTRATQVGGSLANGQLVSPPVPESITP